jgi:hypothetical protein
VVLLIFSLLSCLSVPSVGAIYLLFVYVCVHDMY